ncbi:nudix hydrolase homolog 18 [Striga asiatica]|uniref:Nudix hydrolase homolog 18 n=1 Tax=Striga asiatica TaxID=4170 RepID=A0A5A7R9M1_STRAF|nr:nudix hydrolase homolog 18 [Striga asiatica]
MRMALGRRVRGFLWASVEECGTLRAQGHVKVLGRSVCDERRSVSSEFISCDQTCGSRVPSSCRTREMLAESTRVQKYQIWRLPDPTGAKDVSAAKGMKSSGVMMISEELATPEPSQLKGVSGAKGLAPLRCIPYRIRKTNKSPLIHGTLIEDIEVLLISSQKSPRMMFPKGGWELDEDIELAASRETLEEAGVIGLLGEKLGEWRFKSKSQEKYHEGSMFPLLVTEELDTWPEKNVRRRVWMKVNEAKETCAHSWMKEALEVFVCQVAPREEEKTTLGLCRLGLCRAEDHLRLSIGPQNADEDVDSYLIS